MTEPPRKHGEHRRTHAINICQLHTIHIIHQSSPERPTIFAIITPAITPGSQWESCGLWEHVHVCMCDGRFPKPYPLYAEGVKGKTTGKIEDSPHNLRRLTEIYLVARK